MNELTEKHQFAIKLMRDLIVPTFVLGADGRVIIWNTACENLTGVKAEEVIGTTEHWRAFYEEPRSCLADIIVSGNTSELEGLYASHSESDRAGKGLRAENWCVMPQASTRLYLAINSGPIYGDKGELIAAVETLRDMTSQIKAEEALKNLAHKDGLTGLANRRAFDASLDINIKLAQQGRTPIALIMGDIDHFKLYNDHYGHQAGDDCLQVVAKAMLKTAGRPTDVVARYGGEEFSIILPGVDIEGAKKVGQAILDAIFNLNIPHEKSPSSNRVTMSCGVTSIVQDEPVQAKKLIELADAALYKAKANGRNQIKAAE